MHPTADSKRITLDSTCLAVLLSYRSSRPIMRILGTVMGYMQQERLPRQLLRHQNAYQYLDSFVHGAQNRFKDYEDLLTSQENELRRHTFQALLHIRRLMTRSLCARGAIWSISHVTID